MTNTSPMVAKLGAAALFILLAASSAAAQDYPQRPVKLIVPFPAGGVADTVGRGVAPKLTATWGQQAGIDNRTRGPGPGGAEVGAQAPADGDTLLPTTS